jgi:hypothetical protein
MSILSREAADCREVTNLLLSMILEESDPLASTNPKLASVYECYPPKRLDPRRLP